jgi:hypothetical protein
VATLPAMRDDFHYISDSNTEAIADHVVYLNSHTPLDEPIVVIDGISFVRDIQRYPLERLRVVDPFYLRKLSGVDRQYFRRGDISSLPTEPSPPRTASDMCARAARAGHVAGEIKVLGRRTPSLDRALGLPVFTGTDYTVYSVECPS